jgi:hypothetical protein
MLKVMRKEDYMLGEEEPILPFFLKQEKIEKIFSSAQCGVFTRENDPWFA